MRSHSALRGSLVVVWWALAGLTFFRVASCVADWGGTEPSDWFRWGGPEP